jgi:hypothetical protein
MPIDGISNASRQLATQGLSQRVRFLGFAAILSLSLALACVGFASNAAGIWRAAAHVVTYQQTSTRLSLQLQARIRPMPSCIGTPSDCH